MKLWLKKFPGWLPDLALPLIGSCLIVGLVLGRLVFSPGYVIYRDNFPGQLYYPYLWVSQGSFLAIENYKFVTFTGLFLPLMALGLDVYEKTIFTSVMVIAFLALYWSAFRLLDHLRGASLSRKIRHLASFSAALIYVVNPVAVNTFFDFSLFVGYAFAPLILTVFMEMLAGHRRYVPAVFMVALLWWLSAIKAHWIVFGAVLLFPPLLIYALWHLRGPNRHRLLANLVATAAIVGAYLLVAAYWLIPFLEASRERFIGSYAPLTYESIAFLNNTPLRDTVRLLGILNVWPFVQYQSPSPFLSLPWTLASWVIPALVVVAVIWFRNHWQTWVLVVFALLGIILAKGVASPFPGLYDWLVFNHLIPSSFWWLFRVASKWSLFTSLGYSGLAGLALAELMSRVKRRPWTVPRSRIACLALGTCLIAIPLFTWPSFTGDFNGVLTPVPLPAELVNANQWLAGQPGDYKVNWMPVTNGRELSWNKHPSGDLYTSLSALPSIGTNWNRHPVLYYSYLYETLSKGLISHFGQLLSVLNTRYVAYHNDVISSHIHEGVEPVSVLIEGGEQALPARLAAQDDMRLAWQSGFMSIYQSSETGAPLFVPQRVFLSTGELPQLTSLSSLNSFQLANNAILFDSSRDAGSFQLPVDALLLERDASSNLLMSRVPAEKFISLANDTLHSSVNETWSRFDIYQFDWQAVLRSAGLDVWPFDYGQGMAAYAGSPQGAMSDLKVPVSVAGNGRYHLWVRYLQSPQGGKLQVWLDQRILVQLSSQGAIPGFTWVDLGSLALTGGEHTVSLRGQGGLVVANTLVLLSEEEMGKWQAQGQSLASQYPNIYLLEAERDFDTLDAKISPVTASFSSGRAVELGGSARIRTTVDIATSGEYDLALRISLTTPTKLTVTLGTVTLSITPQEMQTGWVDVGSARLGRGPLPIQVSVSNPCTVDAFWLGGGASRISPETWLEKTSAPAEISYEKIDPTRYRVRVRAERPFFLALSESYDPLWVASGPDWQVSSVPLYGVINGFYIDKLGTYEITVEYKAQQWARSGIVLTSVSIVGIGLAVVLYQSLRSRRARRKSVN